MAAEKAILKHANISKCWMTGITLNSFRSERNGWIGIIMIFWISIWGIFREIKSWNLIWKKIRQIVLLAIFRKW